jgi:hypothetical protein
MRKAFTGLFVLVFVTAFIIGLSASINADQGLEEFWCYECVLFTWQNLVFVRECCTLSDPGAGIIIQECIVHVVEEDENGWQLLFPCARLN